MRHSQSLIGLYFCQYLQQAIAKIANSTKKCYFQKRKENNKISSLCRYQKHQKLTSISLFNFNYRSSSMNKFLYLSLMVSIFSFGCSSSNDGKIKYAETFRGTVTDAYFGTRVADPYRWLEQENDPEVKKWVVAQNEVTRDYLDNISFRDSIFNRMKEIWNYPKLSIPTQKGENYFSYKNDGLQNQSVLMVQKGLNGKAEVFLDPNTFSKDGTTSLAMTSYSHDNKYVAYGISQAGSDWNTFYVMDIEKKEKLKDELKWIKFSGAAWFKNGFFYTRFPEPAGKGELSEQNLNAKIYYHEIGKPQAEDKMIFEYPQNPKIGLGAITTKDEKYLLIELSEGATDNSAVYIKDLSKAESKAVPLIDNFENMYSLIDNVDNELLFLTDKGAPKRKVVKINTSKPDVKSWKEIISEDKNNTLQNVSLVGGKLFCTYMVDAKHEVKVHDLKTAGFLYNISLPGMGTVSGFAGEKTDSMTFYSFTSFVQPTTIYQYNTNTNVSSVYRKAEVKFPVNDYETKQVFVQLNDSTKMPMFIVHKKGMLLTGNNPTLLHGYGGFNISRLPEFDLKYLPFLEQGGVFAMACLRGGGEYGDEWHKAGMGMKKQNVFNDFIAAAEYLVKEKYTNSAKLAIYGRSNGGLLVGAVMAQRPDLCKVALPAVGVMDMLRFHKFTIGHAWISEYGCADTDRKQFENLFKYSPLHNLKKGKKYPATLVTTADHDDRVVPAHSYKFIAELQYAQGGDAPVLIRIETAAGHGSGKSTTKTIEEWADIWAFTFKNLGMKFNR